MNNEYFVPDIEDIRVGYKCDHTSMMSTFDPDNRDNVWNSDDLNIDAELSAGEVTNYILWGWEEGDLKKFIRTPYLTKEQIENEGWEFIFEHNLSFSHVYTFKKDTTEKNIEWICSFSTSSLDYYVVISKKDIISECLNKTCYSGECKSINEFRYICKLLKN